MEKHIVCRDVYEKYDDTDFFVTLPRDNARLVNRHQK